MAPNPRNWRTHPEQQRNALKGLLAEIGIADAAIAYERPDGSLMLIDGHLRAETLDQEIPVLILDVSEDEANKLLVSIDPLSQLAVADAELLDGLLKEVETSSAGVQEMLDKLAADVGIGVEGVGDQAPPPDEFPSVDEGIHTEHKCPKCGYTWSGGK